MNHVDPETLAAWADDSLSSDQARAVESHLADCSECRAVAAAFERTMEGDEGHTALHTSALKWVLPLAASIVLAAGVAWKYWPRTEAPVQIAAATPPMPAPPPPVIDTPPAAAPAPMRPVPPAKEPKVVRPPRASAQKSMRPAVAAPVAAPPPPPVAAAAPPAIVFTPPPPAPAPMPPPARVMSDMLSRGNISVQGAASGSGLNVGGSGGGRGGGARPVNISSTPPIRWRITPTNVVARSLDDGTTWTVVPFEAAGVQIVSGGAPNASVCWLIGRMGAVFVSKNGDAFKRVPFPEAVDLASILALDDLRATVITADGRSFTTEDGGQTWRIARF